MPVRLAKPLPAERIAVLAISPVPMFELSVACEVYGIDRSDVGVPRFELRICAAEPGPVSTRHGFTLDTRYGLDGLAWADTVIVPGWPRSKGERPPEAVLDAVRAAHARGTRLVSFCSGSFVLAAAGILDGQRATTHWMYAAEMARHYPEIALDPSVLYVGDGQVFTSAGTAAGIDLCLHLIREDYGAQVANTIARRMVVPPHREGGQAQFVDAPLPAIAGSDDLATTLDWAVTHLDEPITVSDLASRASMSPRTFARHFRETTGTTPLQWLVAQRVLLAQRLLETTNASVDLVAERCGLGSAANLRAHLGRRLGVAPSNYRETFRQVG